MLFTASAFALVALVVMLTYFYRERLSSFLPSASPLRAGYSRLATFSAQAAHGLSSNNFDLEENNLNSLTESRSGLDERGAKEVHAIMRQQGVSFDEARLIRQKRLLAKNNIDPSGMPLDSKAVTRL